MLAAIEALIVEDQKRRAAEAAAKEAEDTTFDGLSVNALKARFTYDMLAARLRIKSRKTLTRRIKALKLAKAISVVVERPGSGPPSSTWELLISARMAAVRQLRTLHAAARRSRGTALGPCSSPTTAGPDRRRARIVAGLAHVRSRRP